jgi:hypothetical protein
MREFFAPDAAEGDADWNSWTLQVAAVGLFIFVLLLWASETFWWIE